MTAADASRTLKTIGLNMVEALFYCIILLHGGTSLGVMHGMNKALAACLLLGVTALLLAQQPRQTPGTAPGRIATGGATQAPVYAPYELLSVFPQETSPGEYKQVDPGQLQSLSDLGWQLVSVAPYVYRNEHPTGDADVTAPLITQVYLAYFFQRPRLIR